MNAEPDRNSSNLARTNTAARAVVVNRTHRVVREQALEMQQNKQRSRSLWVPLGICSTLLLVMCLGKLSSS